MPSHFKSLAFLLPVLALAAPITEKIAIGAPLLQTGSATDITRRQGWGSVTSGNALSFYHGDARTGAPAKADKTQYICYSGPASNFPSVDSWMSFDSMWALMAQDALTPIGDTPEQQAHLLNAINTVSAESLVDPRVILAVIIGESTGNIHVGCTNNGVQNCGIMQSHNPADTYYDASRSQESITQMVRDGTQGTASGPGLVQLFNDEALTAGNVYNVFRAYNSGSIDYSNLSNSVGATAAYVSNMANFLTGWNGWGAGSGPCGFY